MKDEIKEILDYCNKYINNKYMQYSEPMLNAKSLKLLLEYITNLQERNEKAIEYIEDNFYNVDFKCYGKDLLNILQGEDKDENKND